MERDHYLKRDEDGRYRFRFPLIQRWWKINRGLWPWNPTTLRLLRTGTDFVKAGGKDPGILLGLASTEREILKQALGLAAR